MRNSWQRRAMALAAVALLSVPSAIGVQHALAPTRGAVAAWLAAAGFEAVYISTALLLLNHDLRRYAQRVAMGAVAVAVVLNSIADYGTRVPGGLANWHQAAALFDPLALVLSVGESAPLAMLAYAMATLLHRMAEHESANDTCHDSGGTAKLEQQLEDLRHQVASLARHSTATDATTDVAYSCPHCGETLPNHQSVASAISHGHCRHCRTANGNGRLPEAATLSVVDTTDS